MWPWDSAPGEIIVSKRHVPCNAHQIFLRHLLGRLSKLDLESGLNYKDFDDSSDISVKMTSHYKISEDGWCVEDTRSKEEIAADIAKMKALDDKYMPKTWRWREKGTGFFCCGGKLHEGLPDAESTLESCKASSNQERPKVRTREDVFRLIERLKAESKP